MNAADFLADVDLRPIKLAEDGGGFGKAGLTIGTGSAGLEVVVAEARRKPSQDALRSAWRNHFKSDSRVKQTAIPVNCPMIDFVLS